MATKQQRNPKLRTATIADVEAYVIAMAQTITRAFEQRLEEAGLGRKPKEKPE